MMLSCFLPDNLSRQVPIALFLIARTSWIKHKVKSIRSKLYNQGMTGKGINRLLADSGMLGAIQEKHKQ